MSDVDTPTATGPLVRRTTSGLLTSFVGRETDLEELRALVLDPNVRLITVTGPGGVGKTRLTSELASHLTVEFPGGVILVELAAVTDHEAVPGEILRALGGERNTTVPELEAITLTLGDQPTLLILDNLEQIVSVAPDLQEILMRCPSLKILVTSRLILRVRGEHEFVLEPLDLHEQGDHAQSPAVRLLIDRARSARGSRSAPLDPDIARQICQRVDGLPLAIELAAAQMRVLGPDNVLDRLVRRTPLPSGGPKDMPDRQRTMENAVAWSVDLLTEADRAFFMQMAVFSGGFDLEAAQVLSGLTNETEFLQRLEELLSHSLARRHELELIGTRFSLLETILAYGRKLVVESGHFDDLRRKHAELYLSRAQIMGPALRSPSEEQYRVWKLIEVDIENYRSAVEYFSTSGQAVHVADLVASLDWYWTDGHFLLEGYRLLSSVVDDPAVALDPNVEIKALRVASMLADHLDDLPRVLPLINRAIEAMRASGQDSELAEMLHLASGALINQEQMNAARAKTQETINEARKFGATWFIAAAEMNMSLIDTLEGDYLKARSAAERAAEYFELCGDTDNVLSALNAVAYTWLFEGEFAKAQTAYQDVVVRQSDRMDDAYFFQHVCWGVAAVAAKTGRYELAARITGMARAESKRSQITLRAPLLLAYEAIVSDARRMLGDDHYDRLVDAGYGLSKADAVAEIVSLAEPAVRAIAASDPAPFNQLSNREFEVLLHLMAGRTDPEIAGELFLSPRTVSQHVSSILNKLGVNSRTAAASMAATASIR